MSSDTNGNVAAADSEQPKPDVPTLTPATNGHMPMTEARSKALEEDADQLEGDDTTKLPAEDEEEEALFTTLEQEALQSPSKEPQPKDVKAAPKLLQKALEAGQVQASDSEQESDKDKEDGEKPPEPHVHQRVRCSVRVATCVTSQSCYFQWKDSFSLGDSAHTRFFSKGQSIGLSLVQSIGIFQFHRTRLG
jgi:hypothetical protein